MYLLIILTYIAYLRLCSCGYEYMCPTDLNWRIRSYALCNSTEKYSCLHDANTETSRENCRETLSVLAPGYRYVIRGNLDGKGCNGNRYQPFLFQTNKHNICAIKKSNCNEAGQVVYRNGSTIEDKSCRCDYSKSYAPIHKSSNPCYCVPSTEDCSCHLKLCPVKTHLSAEYTCVSDYILVTLDHCGQIALSGTEDSNLMEVVELSKEMDKEKALRSDGLLLVARITVIAGLLLAVILCIISGHAYISKTYLAVESRNNSQNHDMLDDTFITKNNLAFETSINPPNHDMLDGSIGGSTFQQPDEEINGSLNKIIYMLLRIIQTSEDKEKGNTDDKKKHHRSTSGDLSPHNYTNINENNAKHTRNHSISNSAIHSSEEDTINNAVKQIIKMLPDETKSAEDKVKGLKDTIDKLLQKIQTSNMSEDNEGNPVDKCIQKGFNSNINEHSDKKIFVSNALGKSKKRTSDSNIGVDSKEYIHETGKKQHHKSDTEINLQNADNEIKNIEAKVKMLLFKIEQYKLTRKKEGVIPKTEDVSSSNTSLRTDENKIENPRKVQNESGYQATAVTIESTSWMSGILYVTNLCMNVVGYGYKSQPAIQDREKKIDVSNV